MKIKVRSEQNDIDLIVIRLTAQTDSRTDRQLSPVRRRYTPTNETQRSGIWRMRPVLDLPLTLRDKLGELLLSFDVKLLLLQ